MAVVEQTVSFTEDALARIQAELRSQNLDAWLLYDFHGLNPVAGGLMGLPAMTRRYWVLIPAEGLPIALTHKIEQQPWAGWIGEKRIYSAWQELDTELGEMLSGIERVAMEYSPNDAVPYVDLIPAGVIEMIRAAGPEVVSSADLVSAFYARWTEEGLASHHRAARIVQETAHAAFERIGEMLRAGDRPNEWDLRKWILQRLNSEGLTVGAECIVAVNEHAANPHFAPTADAHANITSGDLVLIDLWGKEDSPDAIYADQTWMGYVGDSVPERLEEIWLAVRDAREAACRLAQERWAEGRGVAGWELDDAARDVIRERGHAEHFIHRTGHSIDRELHGSGPNLDNLETRDTRKLIEGVGFSVEPGIYIPGDVGYRTEVDVYVGPDGPQVTTPDPQQELILIRPRT